MKITFNTDSMEDYATFLAVKALPAYKIQGRTAEFPDEYKSLIGVDEPEPPSMTGYCPPDWMFDYQRDITTMAIQKRKFAFFWDCGLGKTAGLLEFARVARDDIKSKQQGVLIVSPLMVVQQTIDECRRFFPDLEVEHVRANQLQDWVYRCGGSIGITNYDAFSKPVDRGNVGALILDESSMLKSHYGKWATQLLQWGRGLNWKLCATGTPAPNDRIEYANHAVFLDHFPNVNSFLATYFVNRGQTDNRWELKPHALKPFYRAISHWCVFLSDPSVYGWHDNTESIPPIHVHIEPVKMTDEQTRIAQSSTGELFANNLGGIKSRAALGQLGKGRYKNKDVATNKPTHIRESIESWQDCEQTIVWCLYNEEQSSMAKMIPNSASITGSTKHVDRMAILERYLNGEIRTLITKPKILGFGLNLQCCTRQVFSGLQDSYEQYYQAVKRSNRYGSTKPLNVHIPVTDIEEPMVQNVLRKAKMIVADTAEQERLFRGINPS